MARLSLFHMMPFFWSKDAQIKEGILSTSLLSYQQHSWIMSEIPNNLQLDILVLISLRFEDGL